MASHLCIGKVELANNIFLAPMEAVNCVAFRRLCKEFGAGLVYTPMLEAEDYIADPKQYAHKFLEMHDDEHPLCVQITGRRPEDIIALAKHAEWLGADMIDFNMGCPLGPVVGRKSGSYFLKHPEMIERTLKPLIEAVKIPVTVKIRSGWDANNITAIEAAKIAERCGVAAIAVHPRTRLQKYQDKADWSLIKEIKRQVTIPVIGSGDLLKPGAAKMMLTYTKCDAVMFARGAKGNPFIFSDTLELLERGNGVPEPTAYDRADAFLRFMELYAEQKSQRFSELQDHARWFARDSLGFLKRRIELAKNERELKSIFSKVQ